MALPVEPIYTFGVEFSAGSFTNLTSRFERGEWDSSIVDLFRAPRVGHALFELGNGDGILSPRINSSFVPGKAIKLSASYASGLQFTAANSQNAQSAVSSYFNHATQATLEAWVQPASLGNGGNAGVLDSMVNDATNTSRMIFLEGSRMKYRIAVNGTSLHTVADPTTPTLGAPLHYLGTCFVGSYVALYRGGVLVDSLAVPVGSLGMGANHKLRMGSLADDAPTYRWEGIVDDALSWVRGVTAAEAAKHAVGSYDDLSGLVGRWRLNEGRDASAADVSGLGHTLALRGVKIVPEWVRGISPYDTTSAALFFGRITDISLSSRLGARTTVIEATDDWDRVGRLTYNTSLYINTNVRSFYTALMSQSMVNSFSVDAIVDTFDFAWYRDRPAISALFEITQSGAYQMVVDGAGTFYLRDRYWAAFSTGVGSYSQPFDLRIGLSQESVINQMKINTIPRRIATSAQTVAFISAPLLIPGSSHIGFWVNFKDPDEATEDVPVASLAALVSSQDYYGAANSDGTGTNLTANLSLNFTPFAASAVASIFNGSGTAAYLTRFQVRAYPASRLPSVGVQIDAASSQTKFGLKSIVIENQLSQNRPFLESLAQTVVADRDDGRENVRLTLLNEFPDVLRNLNGDSVSVVDSLTGGTGQWRIRGINHDLTLASGLRHTVVYDMEPFVGTPYLVLDHATFGQLDNGRVLAV